MYNDKCFAKLLGFKRLLQANHLPMICRKFLILLLLLIAAGGASAQVIDFSGALSRMESALNETQDEYSMRDIYFLGRAAAAHIINHYPLYAANSALINYLNLICYALAVNSPAPNWYDGYYLMILDTPVINAFATPGGHIFLTRGILEIVTSEDMLAAIIAHEMAHIQLQHGIAVIKHSNFVQSISQERRRISQSLEAESRQQLFSAAVDEYVQSIFSGGYSQLQEFEADSTAFNLLASAGYNPESLIELMRILDSFQWDKTGGLNSTHPLPSQRIENLQRQNRPAYRYADNAARIERFRRMMGR